MSGNIVETSIIPTIPMVEQAGLLGGAWMDPHLRSLVLAQLRLEDFVGVDRGLADVLYKMGPEFNYLQAEKQLSVEGRQRITDIQGVLAEKPTLADFDRWTKKVVTDSQLRAMRAAMVNAQGIIKPGADPEEVAQHIVSEVVRIKGREASKVKDVNSSIDSALDVIGHWQAGNKYQDAVPSGFVALDRVLGGFSRGHICTIAARPGRAKTQLVLQFLRNTAERILIEKRDAVVWIFSAEMTESELMMRLAQAASGISAKWLREGKRDDGAKVSPEDYEQFRAALEDMRRLQGVIKIDPTSAPTTAYMYQQVAADMALHKDGVDMVAFDYLELGDAESENETTRISNLMRGLKQLAKDHKCALVLISQLNRDIEKRADRFANLSDLKQSGQIEALSQQVIFIDWPDSFKVNGKYPSKDVEARAEALEKHGANVGLFVAKNRNGQAHVPVGVYFTPDITRFEEANSMRAAQARMEAKRVA